MDTYQHFKERIQNDERIPNYYEQLVYHASDIIKDIAYNKQFVVAKQLNISPTKLSYITDVLKAIDSLRNSEELEFTALTSEWCQK